MTMYLTEEQLKKYSCKLEKKFFQEFLEEYKTDWRSTFNKDNMYDSNAMLQFLFSYPEVNDKSKEYFYFMCKKTFNDIPSTLSKKYETKFGLINCGNEIYNSYGCAHANLLINCNDVKQSFGCYKCKFSHHLLYCSELRHKSYMAFNKEVSKKRFDELIKMTPEQLESTSEFNGGIYTRINSLIEYIYRLK